MPKLEEDQMEEEIQPIDFFGGYEQGDLVVVRTPQQSVKGTLKNVKGVKKNEEGAFTGYVASLTDAKTELLNQNNQPIKEGSLVAVYLTRSQGLNLMKVQNIFLNKYVTIAGGDSIKPKSKGRKETNTVRITDGTISYGSDFLLRNQDALHLVGILYKDFDSLNNNGNITYATQVIILKMEKDGKRVLPYNVSTRSETQIFNEKYYVLQWFTPLAFYKKVIQSPLYVQDNNSGKIKPILFDVTMNMVKGDDKSYYALKGTMKWLQAKDTEYEIPSEVASIF